MTEVAPRLLKPVPDPLGTYIRPGKNDHLFLADFLAEETVCRLGWMALSSIQRWSTRTETSFSAVPAGRRIQIRVGA